MQFFPGAWHHSDKEGRPLFVLRLGQMDVKGLLRSVGIEALVKFTLSICEQGLLKAAQATRSLGKPIRYVKGIGWEELGNLDVLARGQCSWTSKGSACDTCGARACKVFYELSTLLR